MKFKVLGPLGVSHRNSYVPLPSSRHRKILAALLINADTAVSIERLIDVTWSDKPPATARQQVQNCVGSLNAKLKQLGHTQTVKRCGSRYVLDIDDDAVDERLFRASCHAATQLAGTGRHTQAIAMIRKSLMLWHGHALEDVGSDALVGEAARMEAVRVRALEQLVEWEFIQGRHVELIPELRTWSQVHPYNEILHTSLARALHQASRTVEALEVVRQFRQRLDHELGLGPGAALVRLETQLLGLPSQGGPGVGADVSTLHAIQSALIDLSEMVQALLNDAGSHCRTDN